MSKEITIFSQKRNISMAVIIINIKTLARMPKKKRISTIDGYPEAALRISETGDIEMIVRNWVGRQIWAPIDYCIKDPFTTDELEAIKDEIRY